MVIDSDVPRATTSTSRWSGGPPGFATEEAARLLSDRLDVVSGPGRHSSAPQGRARPRAPLGGDLAQGGEVGERLAEPALDARPESRW